MTFKPKRIYENFTLFDGGSKEIQDWPEEVPSYYGDIIFKLDRVMNGGERAKYQLYDKDTDKKWEHGGRIFSSPDQLLSSAKDVIKPLGGRQSSQFKTELPSDKAKKINTGGEKDISGNPPHKKVNPKEFGKGGNWNLKDLVREKLKGKYNKKQPTTEISGDTIKSASSQARQRGQINRADAIGGHIFKDLNLDNKPFLGGNITKHGAKGDLHFIKVKDVENNKSKIVIYDSELDKWTFSNDAVNNLPLTDIPMSRKDAVLLVKVSNNIRPETKIKHPTYFKIEGY